MNKKLFAAALAVVVAFSLAACGKSDEKKTDEQKQEQKKAGADAVFGQIHSSRVK